MSELAIEIVEDMIELHKDLYPFDLTDDDYEDLVFPMELENLMANPHGVVESLENEIKELKLDGDYFKKQIKLAESIIAKIKMIERRK